MRTIQNTLPALLLCLIAGAACAAPAAASARLDAATNVAAPALADGRYVVQATSVLEAASLVREVGGRILSAIDLIRGVGAMLTGEQAQRLAQMPGVRVTSESALDGAAR